MYGPLAQTARRLTIDSTQKFGRLYIYTQHTRKRQQTGERIASLPLMPHIAIIRSGPAASSCIRHSDANCCAVCVCTVQLFPRIFSLSPSLSNKISREYNTLLTGILAYFSSIALALASSLFASISLFLSFTLNCRRVNTCTYSYLK
jgi:hypothetical protein